MKKAFTLIELLVVVLIIGILSAIALPQYQKAVVKAKYSRFKPVVRAIADAEEVYYLENNEYTADVEVLGVYWTETPKEKICDANGCDYLFSWGYCSINPVSGNDRVVCGDSLTGKTADGTIKYRRVLQQSSSAWAGMQACNAYNNIAHDICKAESGLSEPNDSTDGYYFR